MPTAFDTALTPAALLTSLDADALVVLKLAKGLYDNSWSAMAEDLRRRQAGKPYLFRTQLDPATALVWVELFDNYERARGESVCALVSEQANEES